MDDSAGSPLAALCTCLAGWYDACETAAMLPRAVRIVLFASVLVLNACRFGCRADTSAPIEGSLSMQSAGAQVIPGTAAA